MHITPPNAASCSTSEKQQQGTTCHPDEAQHTDVSDDRNRRLVPPIIDPCVW